jgi:hypothetical protein
VEASVNKSKGAPKGRTTPKSTTTAETKEAPINLIQLEKRWAIVARKANRAKPGNVVISSLEISKPKAEK